MNAHSDPRLGPVLYNKWRTIAFQFAIMKPLLWEELPFTARSHWNRIAEEFLREVTNAGR